ncbi:hypothetical protein ACLOJK_004705 [Asimina triloba]
MDLLLEIMNGPTLRKSLLKSVELAEDGDSDCWSCASARIFAGLGDGRRLLAAGAGRLRSRWVNKVLPLLFVGEDLPQINFVAADRSMVMIAGPPCCSVAWRRHLAGGAEEIAGQSVEWATLHWTVSSLA